ncbi:MAG: hypothetical protein BWY79_00855 [Actinobacteria bacterium ADurb.Bin444]|nr:MAG: hypothetical protein BWY79_00855 [Actinobacteria bacterium ADurb.Bin444]
MVRDGEGDPLIADADKTYGVALVLAGFGGVDGCDLLHDHRVVVVQGLRCRPQGFVGLRLHAFEHELIQPLAQGAPEPSVEVPFAFGRQIGLVFGFGRVVVAFTRLGDGESESITPMAIDVVPEPLGVSVYLLLEPGYRCLVGLRTAGAVLPSLVVGLREHSVPVGIIDMAGHSRVFVVGLEYAGDRGGLQLLRFLDGKIEDHPGERHAGETKREPH